jgi:hypothetical protein
MNCLKRIRHLLYGHASSILGQIAAVRRAENRDNQAKVAISARRPTWIQTKYFAHRAEPGNAIGAFEADFRVGCPKSSH